MRISVEPNGRRHPSAPSAWRVVFHGTGRLESLNAMERAEALAMARRLASRLGLVEVPRGVDQTDDCTTWFEEAGPLTERVCEGP